MVWHGYLKSPLGIVNLAAIIVNTAALIACGLKWSKNGDVFIQVVFQDHGWQTMVMLFLFGSLVIVSGIFIFRLAASNEKMARLTKGGIVLLITIALVLVLFCTIIDVWYVTVDEKENKEMFNRIVAVMVFSIILDLLLVLMMILIGIYYETFYQISDAAMNHGEAFHPTANSYRHPPDTYQQHSIETVSDHTQADGNKSSTIGTAIHQNPVVFPS